MKILNLPIDLPPELCAPPGRGNAADLTAYLLDPMKETADRLRPAVVICPGGGYTRLSEREDQPVAMEYLAAGFQVFSLHYSVAPAVFPRALMELALAVRLIRSHSAQWKVDPRRIVVSGFSAGGHLACSLGVFYNQDFLCNPLGLSPEEIRPDGLLLCYPVITSGEFCHAGSIESLLGAAAGETRQRRLVSLELQAGPHTPPTFLWHTSTDQTVPVENSLLFAQALRRHGVSLELHIYPTGRHGLSLATREVEGCDGRYYEPACQSWIGLAKTWIENLGHENAQ
ncbi:MAG: alpha/beta hydrolase [Enterocloster asparagiformis]|nr:alpha/beta hydrolase [Enterocloster asparagiformis]